MWQKGLRPATEGLGLPRGVAPCGRSPRQGGGAALRKKRAWAGRLPPCYLQLAKTTGGARLGNGCMQRLTPQINGRESLRSVGVARHSIKTLASRACASLFREARPRVPSSSRAPARAFSSPAIQPQLSHLLKHTSRPALAFRTCSSDHLADRSAIAGLAYLLGSPKPWLEAPAA